MYFELLIALASTHDLHNQISFIKIRLGRFFTLLHVLWWMERKVREIWFSGLVHDICVDLRIQMCICRCEVYTHVPVCGLLNMVVLTMLSPLKSLLIQVHILSFQMKLLWEETLKVNVYYGHISLLKFCVLSISFSFCIHKVS